MENRTKFNLKENIQQWKYNLTQESNLTRLNIIELESHLLDLIDDLKQKELDDDEAFIIAKKRIGKTDDICIEFEKVNRSFSFSNKIIPYLKGALIYIAFISFSKFLLTVSLYVSDKLNISSSTFTIINITLMLFMVISLFSLIYFFINKKSSFLNKLNKINILVLLIIISLVASTLLTSLPLSGINPLNISGSGHNIKTYIAVIMNFSIFKLILGFVLLTTSLFFFYKNKKQNELSILN